MATSVVNYTSRVPVSQSLSEIQQRLASSGASHIGVSYIDAEAVGLTFVLNNPHGPRNYRIGVDVDAMRAVLLRHDREGRFQSQRKAKGHFTSREHAAGVAWRITKDWLAATLALVECEMVTLDEVALPFLMVEAERTLAEVYRERESVLAIEC